eukprot:RCo039642
MKLCFRLMVEVGSLLLAEMLPACHCTPIQPLRGRADVYIPNPQPVIGVLDQPWKNSTVSYIAASYVKFLEMAGGRGGPFHWDCPKKDPLKSPSTPNGVLFSGGGGVGCW